MNVERHINVTTLNSPSHPGHVGVEAIQPKTVSQQPQCKLRKYMTKKKRKTEINLYQLALSYPMHSCTRTQESLWSSVWCLWQHSTWPHLISLLWAVTIFIFCCCSLHLPLHSGSVCNPFIVTAVWRWQYVRGQARVSLRKCLFS